MKSIPTRIEDLQAFDIILHLRSVWVIQRISKGEGIQYRQIHATRVDDGKQTTMTFHSHSFGYLMERLVREG